MNHENDVSNVVGCLQVVRIYSFMKELKYTRASYIVFLFVKTENINFIKEIKYVSVPSQPGENQGERL